MYYEAHITLADRDTIVHPPDFGRIWSHSCIEGDKMFGKKVLLHYATRHYKHSEEIHHVIEDVEATAKSLQLSGWCVLRKKVELILWDKHEQYP